MIISQCSGSTLEFQLQIFKPSGQTKGLCMFRSSMKFILIRHFECGNSKVRMVNGARIVTHGWWKMITVMPLNGNVTKLWLCHQSNSSDCNHQMGEIHNVNFTPNRLSFISKNFRNFRKWLIYGKKQFIKTKLTKMLQISSAPNRPRRLRTGRSVLEDHKRGILPLFRLWPLEIASRGAAETLELHCSILDLGISLF